MRPAGKPVRTGLVTVLAVLVAAPLAARLPLAPGQQAVGSGAGGFAGSDERGPLAVQILSPLGRVDGAGTVRIVAQVTPADASLRALRFFVDGQLLHVHEEGPPYAAEWVDDNPFERREISVEAADASGNLARDAVVLEPLEIALESGVTSVLIEASVRDRAGRVITGLTGADFTLTEDGVPQSVDLFVHERVPATFALLIDTSQSLARSVGVLREAAGRVTSHLGPDARVMVAPFSRMLHPPMGPFEEAADLIEALDGLQIGGGTAIFDALVELAGHLSDLEGRRAVVLITDGYDEHSARTLDEALQAAQEASLTVYIIGVGGVSGISLSGERMLRRLAEQTGGDAYFPSRDWDLAYAYEQLVTEVENRYLLSYTPSNQEHDGRWRDIKVAVPDAAWIVRARPGYLAPEPPPVRATLEFTVTDLDGGYPEIAREDIVVLEDGVEQEIDTFQEAVTPVALVLALDASASMHGSAEQVRTAASAFVEALQPQDRLAVVTFADRPTLLHALTTNRQSSLDAIAAYETAGGGAAVYDAMDFGLQVLRRVDARRVVLLISPGLDEDGDGSGPGSARSLENVEALLRETDATVYAIGVGERMNREVLERLADRSGGQAYFPTQVPALKAESASMIENLRRRYVIRYTSSNFRRDGAWREVQIDVRSANVIVRSRGGYLAPGARASVTPVPDLGQSQPGG